MESQCDIDLTTQKTWRDVAVALEQVGGLPVIVMPLNDDRKVVAQGCGCVNTSELRDAIQWAYRVSPAHFVRLVPAKLAQSA